MDGSASCHMHELPGVRFRGGSKWVHAVLVSLLEVSLLEGLSFQHCCFALGLHLAMEGPDSRLPSTLDPPRTRVSAWYREELHGLKRAVISDRRFPFILRRNQPRGQLDSGFPASRTVRHHVPVVSAP